MVIDEKTQTALSQMDREEKAVAADEVSPIARHRASMARLKVMGFAEPVIGPATSAGPVGSIHPTGWDRVTRRDPSRHDIGA